MQLILETDYFSFQWIILSVSRSSTFEAKMHLAYTKNSSELENCSLDLILIDTAKQ